jgi:putative tryptophan/tyrosine transport system substrate-binding protein
MRVRRIGILEMAAPDPERLALWELFKARLRELGHVEGDDIALEFTWAEGRQERLAAAAAEFVRSNVDVLVTTGTPAAAAASRATTEIPVIMATGVAIGTQLGDGATGPNANVTGISDLPPGVSEKRLRLLREMVSGPLAFLADRANPSSPVAVRETQEAAGALGMTVSDYWVAGAEDIDQTLAGMTRDGVAGFVVAPGAMFFAHRTRLATSAKTHRLASMSVRREYAEAGCLTAYGAPIRENYWQAALYVSRVLGGTKPAELPVEQPTQFDFVINRATAAAIGCVPSPSLLAKAELI